MTILRIACILAIAALPIHGVLNNGPSDSYGPPPRGKPAPVYGPPPVRVPHREYGVPQQIPFREYGPPALKYGPPKLNFNFGQKFQGGFNDQIKSHFGVPKPFYGPPHLHHKPAATYGPPPQGKPFTQYGPPPPKPQATYGPPRPAATYGPPQPQPLPLIQPGPIFKPVNQGYVGRPHTSYGPPPSGQFINKPNLSYGPPKPNYGPPPLPNFNRVPETTIIVTNGGNGGGIQGGHGPISGHGPIGGPGPFGGPVKQVQIQIENQGTSHGSAGHFHTASCDGWKPIPAPVGHYVEQNQIQTQAGYSSAISGGVDQSLTQYSSNNVGGLSDEQLVAVALQSGGFETTPLQSLPASGPADFHGGSASGAVDNHLNSIESEALQISLGAIDDSYSKPPRDSYAPNSFHAQKYNTISNGESHALVPPSGSYGAPPTGGDFNGNSIHVSDGGNNFAPQSANLGILYGTQTGNQRPWLGNGLPPSKPVTYRAPVPQGLLESIGETVQHLDQFGVKPPNTPPTYIPPPSQEIAEPSSQYGPPQQELTPQTSVNIEFHHQSGNQNQFQQNFQTEERGNSVQQQYLPPPLPVPAALQQPYIPPPRPSHQFQGGNNNFAFGGGEHQFIHTQGLPHTHEARFNQPQDCGHGPNLVGGNFQQQVQLFQEHHTPSNQYGPPSNNYGPPSNTYGPPSNNYGPPALPSNSYGPPPTPADTYGPPSTGNGLDVIAYESKRSSVTSLPDDVNSENLPGLDGLNVISAQKSQAVSIPVPNQQSPSYQIQIQSSNPSQTVTNSNGHTNHDEVLSQGLLQSILTAIEQPQNGNNQQATLQNRSDIDVHLDEDASEKEEDSSSSKSSSTKAIVAESSESSEATDKSK